MKSDSLFYTLFQQTPELLFRLIGILPPKARKYSFRSVEVKALSFRIDGVLALPSFAETFFFVEIQFQFDKDFYARLFAEIMLFLRQYKPVGDWQVVVIFPTRSTDPQISQHYREFVRSGRVTTLYLDELPEIALHDYPMNLLRLIGLPDNIPLLVEAAQEVLRSAKDVVSAAEAQKSLLTLVISILSAKISTFSLEEIETMINPMILPEPLRTDFLNSRAYKDMLALQQKGLEQGLEQGLEKMYASKITTAQKLLAMGLMTVEQIADVTDLPEKEVRALQKKKRSKKTTS